MPGPGEMGELAGGVMPFCRRCCDSARAFAMTSLSRAPPERLAKDDEAPKGFLALPNRSLAVELGGTARSETDRRDGTRFGKSLSSALPFSGVSAGVDAESLCSSVVETAGAAAEASSSGGGVVAS